MQGHARFFAIVVILGAVLVAAPTGARLADVRPLFEFHSGFWINLHEFLYQQALSKQSGSRYAGTPNKLAPEWAAALAFYRKEMISRDLLLDGGMIAIKNSLEDQEDAQSLTPTTVLPAPLATTLERAARIYRATWWQQQDQANKHWIAQVSPMVGEHGGKLARELSSIYQTQWPATPIRVDVTNYANWAGAYTTNRPTRVTISSMDPRNQGIAALETVFHEASHGISGNLERAIAAECKKQDVTLPREDLWHAVIFYTAGELVRQDFAGYTPYAYQNELWNRAWPMYIGALDRDWKPYIEGKTSFQTAIANLVKDVGEHRK